VRKLARELGVVLGQVKASGEHGRVMKDDVFAYVKTRLTAPQPLLQHKLLQWLQACQSYQTLVHLVVVK
jgi:pyruvate/2-oxoglutarate dehydrogenase complex dihydrolipoamide acyltransferase (E2) component